MKQLLAACAMLAAAAAVHAAPPPGHPAAGMGGMQAPQAGQLPFEGKVVNVIDTDNYTYVEVSYEKSTRWLAAPRTALKKGATVRYGDGAQMVNFRSRQLNRVFPSILFVNEVVPK